MQTVSASLASEQGQSTQRYYRVVELYKKYWNGAGYVWDAVQDITAYVNKVSTAKWKLDTQSFNEFKSPSFQLDVDNTWGTFNDADTRGLWSKGANAPYVPELSRVRVRCGQVLQDGTRQDLYVFGGVINRPIQLNQEKRTATVFVAGMDTILSRTKAYPVGGSGGLVASTQVLIAIGVGNGSTTDFTTPDSTVGEITELRVGPTAGGSGSATVKTEGLDYQVSQLADYTLGAKVSIAIPPPAGNTVWASYYTWYKDKDTSWIITQLLGLGGITNYQVDPTVFGNAVSNTITETTKADFDASTSLTNIDTALLVDSFQKKWYLLDDWSDGTFNTNPQWNPGDGVGANWSAASGHLVASNPTTYLRTVSFGGSGTSNTGSYDMKAYPTSGYARLWYDIPNVSNPTQAGARLEVSQTQVAIITRSGGADTTRWSTARVPGANDVYRVTRTTDGSGHDVVTVYVDSGSGFTLLGTVTFNGGGTVTNGTIAVDASGNCTFYYIYYSATVWTTQAHETGNGVLVSQTLDGTASLSGWGSLTYAVTTNNGTVLVETLSADNADMSSPDPAGWLAISVSGQIQSAAKRYLRVRFTLTSAVNSIPRWVGPIIADYSVVYLTSTTTIQVVNMSGLDCYSAIKQLSSSPCYEFGFNASEKFFYRARKSTSSPVLTISKDTNLESELTWTNGRDKILNTISATFGQYKVTVDCNTQGQPAPNSLNRDGVVPYTVPGSSLLPAPSANVAKSAAISVFNYASVARHRAQVQMKFLMQYELGDVVTYQREHRHGRWTWGDGSKRYGSNDPDFFYYTAAQRATWDYNMRIEGIEFDTEPGKWRLRYDLTEAL